MQVLLNVGGSKFTTTVSTLRNAPSPSLFNAMFSGRHALKKDEQGGLFIDRWVWRVCPVCMSTHLHVGRGVSLL